MRGSWRKMTATLRLMAYALLPAMGRRVGADAAGAERRPGYPGSDGAAPALSGRLCDAVELRGGVDRLLDARGELHVIFADCLGIAAPFVLFRLKRQGYSRCVVRVLKQGLYVEARR